MLKNLRIQNFKILKNISLELSNLNILSGLNGMGKSSVVQALLLLRQSYLAKALPDKGLLLRVNEGESLTEIGTGNDALSKEVEERDNPISFELETELEKSAKFFFDYLRKEDDSNPDQLIQLRRNPLLRKNTTLSSFSAKIFEESLFKHDGFFQYLYAERIGPKEFNDTNFGYIEQRNLGKFGQYALHYLDTYQKASVKNTAVHHPKTTKGRENLLEQVSYWLSDITPNTRMRTEYLLDIDKVKGEFNIDDNDSFKPTNVGFGLTYVLPVIIALLTVEEGGMLIIENPESHLHPAGQSKMTELIAKCAASGRQIFIETHSDHIIHGIMVATYENSKDSLQGISNELVKMYYFEKSKNNPKTAEPTPIALSETGRIKNAPQGFFDQFNIDLKRMLQ
ncbi:MAG: DUF3696 domain-containing protein [Microscillaceae bacterium]|nr:DUF3696 domain-containing protein [Microscillaceae bacterium]